MNSQSRTCCVDRKVLKLAVLLLASLPATRGNTGFWGPLVHPATNAPSGTGTSRQVACQRQHP